MQLYRFRHSTNVDRVSLALAHKGLEVESVWIDPADRSAVEAVSGQSLVPVLIDGERIVTDSPQVLEHLEAAHPDPPLYPSDPARAAEVRLFVDWFNRVWKVAPNAITDALDGDAPASAEQVATWKRELAGRQRFFEGLLNGRDHLFGDFGAADCIAWPFLRYALWRDEDDTETFHVVLEEGLPLDGFPNLRAWIERVREERWPAASEV